MRQKFYVITRPETIRGIYETWAECEAKVRGVRGAVFQKVDSREKAEAMLGGGIALPGGTFVFTDGNAAGGVGVVVVHVDGDGDVFPSEIATSVDRVFRGSGIAGLHTTEEVDEALGRLHNILAELAGLLHGLRLMPRGRAATIVHDYEGISAWMQERWKINHPTVQVVIEACRREIEERELEVSYRHQRGHQSSWAGRDDFARWNGRADKLATEGFPRPPGSKG